MSDVVTHESQDAISIITLNRPEKMNALNEELILSLQEKLKIFQESHDRVAILHASGDKAFSVGADIKDPPKEMWQGVPSIGSKLSKPIIAAVHGWCIGGAYVIVQMCDLVVASENTIFKYPEAQLGFTGGLIASAVSRIPHKLAMEFMLLGKDFSAERAKEVGMVNKVVGQGRASGINGMGKNIGRICSARGRDSKSVFSGDPQPKPSTEAGAIARHELLKVSTSEDGAEGRRAFAEKRDPSFRGK